MTRWIRSLACGGVLAAAGMLEAQEVPVTAVRVQTWMLRHLDPSVAATLVTPYVDYTPHGGVFLAGGTVRGITVRAIPAVLARVDSILKVNDREAVSVRVRYQVVAALDSAFSDPALAPIEAELRGVLRYNGYRMLAQGVVTMSGGNRSELTLTSGQTEPFMIRTYASQVDGGTAALDLSLQGWPWTMDSGGRRSGVQIISTVLTVPFGQSIVVGSGAATLFDTQRSGPRTQALLLVVRADPVGGKP